MASEEQTENLDEVEYEIDDEAGAYSQSSGRSGYGRSALDEEGEAELEEEELFSRLGDSSDDPDQKRLYYEYLSLIKEIECQNQIIEEIKGQIMQMCAKACKTKCEIKEIKRMRVVMETENIKLRCLMNKAMQLQNFGSHRRYQAIPIATTVDEDNMTPYVGTIPPQSSNWKGEQSSEADQPQSCQDPPTPPPRETKEEKRIRCLCNAMCKMKICCPEDKKLVKEIAAALCCRPKQEPCGSRPRASSMRKYKSMQQQQRSAGPPSEGYSLEKLKQKISCMQSSVHRLKQEIARREREQEGGSNGSECEQERKVCVEEADPTIPCLSKRNTKGDQLEALKQNYIYLLAEFSKKDAQIKQLEKRMKGFCGGCNDGPPKPNADQAELQMLRVRCADMKEEQTEFKCIMKEQSQQLEDYRNKYLVAQQKVEEQSVTLEKLNMNNKRIEKQINTEVKEIRAKFQEKLNELLHFPKLLENEQLKLANVCKEKDDLQSKLILVCKELKSLKSQVDSPKNTEDCRPQLARCQMELSQTQDKLAEMEKQRDLFCEQLKTTQDDLDTLRCESAKIIARTKERSEMTKHQQQEQIDRLEKELAQCRATACLSVNDRESVIREMQGQLNTLSYSFDAAQKQIKTLRNHVAYVSNENCFPVKC